MKRTLAEINTIGEEIAQLENVHFTPISEGDFASDDPIWGQTDAELKETLTWIQLGVADPNFFDNAVSIMPIGVELPKDEELSFGYQLPGEAQPIEQELTDLQTSMKAIIENSIGQEIDQIETPSKVLREGVVKFKFGGTAYRAVFRESGKLKLIDLGKT